MKGRGNGQKHEYNGEILTIAELSKLSEASASTVLKRIKAGWSLCDAVDRPVEGRKISNTPSKGTVDSQYNKGRKRSFTTYAKCSFRSN
ncbi:hypothetical protein KAR91_82450 [Candidatus Pacearchaeota archaeon]|nr:hypothetical protein [Candidatus Pacearchaeota archaeon]